MDDFVCGKLTEWGLSDWIENFRVEGIDEKLFMDIEEAEIADLISRPKPRIIFRKQLKKLKEQQEADLTEVQPSTSAAGKRKLPLQGESSKLPTPAKRNRKAELKDAEILSEVKKIMSGVNAQLERQNNTELIQFLKDNIKDLETDKRELVGVFGKTGAGKSSLINAVIGEDDLLTAGAVHACTSVMIKVEANMQSKNYEAEIEFIAKEDWKAEVWSMLNFLENNPDEGNSQDDNAQNNDYNNEAVDYEDDNTNDEDINDKNEYHNYVEKLTALYEEDWRQKSSEELMGIKYFKEIPEFLGNSRKVLLTRTAKELSEELEKYTIKATGKRKGSSYWPLVKYVTVKVPDNELLQHVTLVDLPGNGDRNKSRDSMWKQMIGNCSTVWVVSETNRVASEKESWHILESVDSLLGNGGECRQIHFICTKFDQLHNFGNRSAEDVRNSILSTKESMRKEFQKLKNWKNFQSEIFMVCDRWFHNEHLSPEDSEIFKLQDILRELNDDHSEALNYVSGACGILSLIQGTSLRDVAGKSTDVCEELDRNMRNQLVMVNATMKSVEMSFDKQLSEGVEKAKRSWEKKLKSVIDPPKKRRGGFHRVLKCLVENGGIYKPKKKPEININMKLSSFLTECIDEEFRKTFPNETKCGPFNGAINRFSLDTENLKKEHKNVELQLIFLKTEEEKIKTRLSKTIRDHKKKIYLSLTKTIEEAMEECYDRAEQFSGKGSLNNMTEAIKNHVQKLQNTMFEEAKQAMLAEMRRLAEKIISKLRGTLNKSIKYSLKTNDDSIPDFTADLRKVQQFYNKLKNASNEEVS